MKTIQDIMKDILDGKEFSRQDIAKELDTRIQHASRIFNNLKKFDELEVCFRKEIIRNKPFAIEFLRKKA